MAGNFSRKALYVVGLLALVQSKQVYPEVNIKSDDIDCSPAQDCNTCMQTGPECSWCPTSQVCGSPATFQQNECSVGTYNRKSYSENNAGPQNGILPNSANLFLRYLDPFNFIVKITKPATSEIEFLYVMDASSSFQDEYDRLKLTVHDIANTLQRLTKCENDKPCVYGKYATFIDKYQRITNHQYVHSYLPVRGYITPPEFDSFKITGNFPIDGSSNDKFIMGAKSIKIGGNDDLPESSFDGIMQAILCNKWNPDRKHILLVVTDDTSKLYGDYEIWYSKDDLLANAISLAHKSSHECFLDLADLESESDSTEQWNLAIEQLKKGRSSLEQPPTLGEIKSLLLENNIYPIFGITDYSNPVPYMPSEKFWPVIQNTIQWGQWVKVENSGANILPILEEAYGTLSNTLQMQVNPNTYNTHLIVEGFDPEIVSTGLNITNMDSVEVTIRILADFNDKFTGTDDSANPIIISVVGLGQIKLFSDKLQCDCDKNLVNEDNVIVGLDRCGIIECTPPWEKPELGCTCNGEITVDEWECDFGALKPDDWVDCNGNGICECHVCHCYLGWDDGVTPPVGGDNPYCACSDCPTINGEELCSGHGRCECGKCVCEDGYDETTNCLCPSEGGGHDCPNGSWIPGGDSMDVCGGYCECNPGFIPPDCKCKYPPNDAGPCGGAYNCEGICTCENPEYDPSTNCDCKYGSTTCSIETCNGHGYCEKCSTTCKCSEGWVNENPDEQCNCRDPSLCECGENGKCDCEGNCICADLDEDIATACKNGTYCNGHGYCDVDSTCNLSCICDPDYQDGNYPEGNNNCLCLIEGSCPGNDTGAEKEECYGHGVCNHCTFTCDCDQTLGDFVSNEDCKCIINEEKCNVPSDSITEHCNASLPCCGHGDCVADVSKCNVCECNDVLNEDEITVGTWTGQYCSCPNTCLANPDCGVNSNGCKECSFECSCKDGWEQHSLELGCLCNIAIQCYINENPASPEILEDRCSGHGVCNVNGSCGCTCTPPYSGWFCELCDSNEIIEVEVSPDSEFPFCIDENGKPRLVTKTEICATYICPSAFCAGNDCQECQDLDERLGCMYCLEQGGCVSNTSPCDDKNPSCEPDSLVPVIAGSVGGVIAAFLLAALIAKAIFLWKDKVAWDAFNAAKNDFKWNSSESPLFVDRSHIETNPMATEAT